MLFVIDDTANEDEEAGVYGWAVSTDETGQDDDAIIARFKDEKMAEMFVEYANSKHDGD